MDLLTRELGDPSVNAYLHYQFEKFWEIKVYKTHVFKTRIRCGKLNNGRQEEISTVQVVDKEHNSEDDATKSAKKLIDLKISKGYLYLNKTLPQSNRPTGLPDQNGRTNRLE